MYSNYQTVTGVRYWSQNTNSMSGVLFSGGDCAEDDCNTDESGNTTCTYLVTFSTVSRDRVGDSGPWSDWTTTTGQGRELTINYNCKTGEAKK